LAYFEAIEGFGAETIAISNLKSQRHKLTFLQTHLIGCAKEKNIRIFRQLVLIISSKSDSETGFIMPFDGLGEIIHYKTKLDHSRKDSIFDKTALNWAIENNDKFMAMELLMLEHEFHVTEEEGLKCLQDKLSSNELLPWIFKEYTKFYNKTQYWDSFKDVFVKDVLMSHLPYFMDIYSDITLAISYREYSSETYSVTELWTCGDTSLNLSCFGRNGSEHSTSTGGGNLSKSLEDFQNCFSVAFWSTVFLILFTVCFYIISIALDSRPLWLSSLLGMINGYLSNLRCCNQQRIISWCLEAILVCVSKLIWPFVYFGRQLVYLASPKRGHYKPKIAKSTAI
jgi:hypothetical protein